MFKNTKTKEEKAIKTQQAVSFRLAKLSYAQIAKKMGVSASTVFNLVKKEMERIQKNSFDGATELIMMEAANLDRMEKGLYDKVGNGDEKAIKMVLDIQNRRAKLFALDAPIKQHIEIDMPEPIRFVIN